MYGRRLPPSVLRGVIVVVGVVAAVRLLAHLTVSRVARNRVRRRAQDGQPRIGHVEHVVGGEARAAGAAARPPAPRSAPRRSPPSTSASRSARCGSSTRAAMSAAASSATRACPSRRRSKRRALEPPFLWRPWTSRLSTFESTSRRAREHPGGVAAEAHEQHARPRGRAARARAAARPAGPRGRRSAPAAGTAGRRSSTAPSAASASPARRRSACARTPPCCSAQRVQPALRGARAGSRSARAAHAGESPASSSSRLSTLPAALRGSSSRNSISRGTL